MLGANKNFLRDLDMSLWPVHWTLPGVEIFIFLSPWLPKDWTLLGVSITAFIAVTAAGMFLTQKVRNTEAQKLGREISWATLASYTVVSIGTAFVSLRTYHQPSFWIFVVDALPKSAPLVFLIFFLFYWPIPLFILFPYKNGLHRRWHVWGAWICTTGFLAWELLAHGKMFFLIMGYGFASAPMITAVSGWTIGEAIFRAQNALGISLPNLLASRTIVFIGSLLLSGLLSVVLISFEP